MTFTRTRSPLTFSYHIHDSIISHRDGFMMDLDGFKLSSNLYPSLHIEMACCKALRMLSIIMRLSKDLNLTTSLKVLYCSLVRPIIEYGAIIWDPHTADNACQVERVQRRVLLFKSLYYPVWLDQQIIPQNDSAKYLGIHLDSWLNWKHHVRQKKLQIKLKFRKLYWLIGRHSEFDLTCKRILYLAIIKPICTYGI